MPIDNPIPSDRAGDPQLQKKDRQIQGFRYDISVTCVTIFTI